MMRKIIISNNSKLTLSDGWEFVDPSTIIDEGTGRGGLKIVDRTSYFFLIYVHCTFDGATNLQSQGGLIIYRHLLKVFDGKQDALKVIFYSPLSQVELVKSKPENYVLNLLPFIQAEQGTSAKDGNNFGTKKINDIIKENAFTRFNNASENLLSGWALANSDLIKAQAEPQKVDLLDRTMLVIDDEWRDWSRAYKEILSSPPSYLFEELSDSALRAEFKKLNTSNFNLPDLGKSSFLLSDLYLWERHETHRFKTDELVNSISGLLLFRRIRKVEPAIPVLFHTTSTKFRIFEALSELGSDGQVVKNVSATATVEEKEDNFLAFGERVASIVGAYGQCWYNEMYRITQDPSTSWLAKRWKDRFGNRTSYSLPISNQDQIFNLLRNLIVTAKRFRSVGQDYLDGFFKGSPVDPLSFNAASMIRTAGLISELIPRHSNPELTLIAKLRNHASHAKNYKSFTPFDVLLVLNLLRTLNNANRRTLGTKYFLSTQRDFCGAEEMTHPVFDYIHYFNNWNGFLSNDLRNALEVRIRQLADDYFQNDWQRSSDANLKRSIISNITFLQEGPFGENMGNGNFTISLPV